MDCPKCVGKLQNRVVGTMEHTPFHVDQCFVCNGFWFDSGELTKALALKFSIARAAEDFITPSQEFDHINELKAPCPRCRKDMVKVPSLQDHRIKLDYCVDCDGFWTDGGEFELLMKGGYLERALKKLASFMEMIHRRRGTRYQGDPEE